MKTNSSAKNKSTIHIPNELSDDLRPHYDVDYSKTRPNPYANRPKIYRGGARVGAGRKPAAQPMERHTITVHPSDAKFLRSLDANLSKAIRKLIAKAR
ncbi:MAG: hypothetical protein HY782_15855 [Chloroflexi bacterium]|nr:hypothetical protein [Chloroflexota bacterium]